MNNSNNQKQACRFFLQGRCNRGNSCKWSHDPAGNIAPAHSAPWRGTGAGSVDAIASEPSFPHSRVPPLTRLSDPQAPGRGTDNASNRGRGGHGSRRGGRQGRPTAQDKGKAPAEPTIAGTLSNDENPGTSSTPYWTGSRGRPASRARQGNLRDGRGRGGGSNYRPTDIWDNSERNPAPRIRGVVESMKNMNVNVCPRAPDALL